MKISVKYENELKKLFELSKKTYVVNFQLKNEELISNFSNISDEEKINIQLGKEGGKALNIFNDNIIDYKVIGE